MNNRLRLCIKKTNRHLHLYVLDSKTQLINISTNNRMLKNLLTALHNKYHTEAISYILARTLFNAGICTVSLIQSYPYHGKVRIIIETLKRNGIDIR